MLICDAHADTLFRMAYAPGQACDLSLERLRKGGVSLQVLTLFVGMDPAFEAVKALFEKMLKARDTLAAQGWRQTAEPGESRDGETRFMLSVEGCEVLNGRVDAIRKLYRLGVRMAALTWNYQNALGTPAAVSETEGLTPFGIAAAREMQRLGIAVDVSHLNVAGFYDVLSLEAAPPLASHSCCRALCDHPRNLTDRQLKDLFRAGGYIGINFFPRFLAPEGAPCDVGTVVSHIDRCHQLGGAGMVGFGSDFDGITQKPAGLDNPEDFPKLIEELRARGYKEQDVRNIAGQSFLDYFGRIGTGR